MIKRSAVESSFYIPVSQTAMKYPSHSVAHLFNLACILGTLIVLDYASLSHWIVSMELLDKSKYLVGILVANKEKCEPRS